MGNSQLIARTVSGDQWIVGTMDENVIQIGFVITFLITTYI